MPDRAVTTTRSRETALGQRLGGMTDPGFDRPEVHAEDALLSRRSIRSFEDKPVPNSLMRRIWKPPVGHPPDQTYNRGRCTS